MAELPDLAWAEWQSRRDAGFQGILTRGSGRSRRRAIDALM
jgi:hypothetical protein